MSLQDSLPSKTEVQGWNPHQLAEFMKRMNLQGCDKIVAKTMMTGSRFLNMSDNDLQRFPKIHAPLISKLCSGINKKEERRSLFGKRSTGPRFPEPGLQTVSADGHGFSDSQQAGWGEDEFDEVSDDDYEEPDGDDGEGSVGDYEDPTDDGGGGDFADGDDDNDNDYEPPPSEAADNLAQKIFPSHPLPAGEYIDNRNSVNRNRGGLPPVTPRPSGPVLPPPSRPAGETSPEGRFPVNPVKAPPPVLRDKKPTRAQPAPLPGLGPQFNAAERHSWRAPVSPLPPSPSSSSSSSSSSSVSRSNSSVRTPDRFVPEARMETQQEDMPPKHHTFPLIAAHNKELPPRPGLSGLYGLPGPPPRNADSLPPSLPAAESLPQRLQSVMIQRSRSTVAPPSPRPSPPTSLPSPTEEPHSTQELDPRWYVGKVTRGEAESCLKQVNKDGAYVVRDSSKQPAVQPYTLMVLYQSRVFNIQVRRHGGSFLLGTGLKVHETFASVSDIIRHYSQNALLLINAKDRGTGHQSQCMLSHPAGHCVTETVNTWT